MIKRIKLPLRDLYHELKLIKYTAKSEFSLVKSQNTLTVHFDSFLMNTDMGRFSFILCQYLKFCGFELIVKIDKEFVRNLAPPYKRLFLKQNYRLMRAGGATANVVELVSRDGSRKILEIFYGYKYAGTFDSGAYYMPFPLHPKFYVKRMSSDELSELRIQNRNMYVFFAGNSDSRFYDKDVLREHFKGTISRLSALKYINERFLKTSEMELVTDAARLYELLGGGAAKIVISEARTSGDQWLSILGKAHFFLCLPGVRMPWSHNAIESMAVGTIPIIQYGSLFTPPLEHMKNALCYSDQEELGKVLSEAITLPEHEIARLRRNVIQYYDHYLSTEIVVGRLKEFLSSNESYLRVVIPFLENPVK